MFRLLLADDHQLLTFGDSRHGKLCTGEEESNVFTPQPASELLQLCVARVSSRSAGWIKPSDQSQPERSAGYGKNSLMPQGGVGQANSATSG